MTFSTNLAGTTFGQVDDSQQFALGVRSLGNDGSEWMYVKSGAAITAYDTVHINVSFVANAITPALAVTAGDVGFANAVSCSTSGQYFWAMVRGNPTIRLAANCQPAVPLYTTDTAGVLDDATASLSHYQVMGTLATTSNSAASSSVGTIASVANFPMIRRPIGTA